MKTNTKLEVTYKSIRQLEKKLKLKGNYQGLNSVAIYLVNLYFDTYYNVREYEFFTHYKAVWLWTYLKHWLAVEDDEIQFGHKVFDFKQYLEEAENDLRETKKNIFKMWKYNTLSNHLENKKQILLDTVKVERYDTWRLKLYVEMLEVLVEIYPTFKQNEVESFRKEIGYAK